MSSDRIRPSSYTLHRDAEQKKEIIQRSPTYTRLRPISGSPYPALLVSAASLLSLSAAKSRRMGVPSVMQCNLYTAIFGASAYALASGDVYNGSGLAAGWSAIWLFFNGRNAIKSMKPLPLGMTVLVTAVGSLYGWRYATINDD